MSKGKSGALISGDAVRSSSTGMLYTFTPCRGITTASSILSSIFRNISWLLANSPPPSLPFVNPVGTPDDGKDSNDSEEGLWPGATGSSIGHVATLILYYEQPIQDWKLAL